MRFLLLSLAVVVCASSCASPLASRRAQVLEKGEVEMIVVPTAIVTGGLVEEDGARFPVLPLPHVEASVRFGIFDRVDMQLKVDEALFPELAFGWQVIGDPTKNEFALTVGAGAKLAVFPLSPQGGAGNISVPLQLLVDVPVGEEGAIYFGTRTIVGVAFGVTDTGDAGGDVDSRGGLAVTPGLVVGLSLPIGAFLLQPELAANAPIGFGTTQIPPAREGLSVGYVALGVGVGARFDLQDLRRK